MSEDTSWPDAIDWARSQLDDAGYGSDVRDAVLDLLAVFYGARHPMTRRDLVLSLFGPLARGISLPPATAVGEVWIQARLGQIEPGQLVRVRHDAFDDERAQIHNGRVGIITNTARGHILVRYTDDREPALDRVQHDVKHLEKRIR